MLHNIAVDILTDESSKPLKTPPEFTNVQSQPSYFNSLI